MKHEGNILSRKPRPAAHLLAIAERLVALDVDNLPACVETLRELQCEAQRALDGEIGVGNPRLEEAREANSQKARAMREAHLSNVREVLKGVDINLPLAEIASILNGKGSRMIKGDPWTKNGVAKLLRQIRQ